MTYRAVDCQAFAGGFTLGMVQAGFDLVGKKEMIGGFGVPNCMANRHLLGDRWEPDVADPGDWEPIPADVVFGNPPCSGFSLLSSKNFRGMNSPANACMWAFANFTAKTMPLIGIFESVQQAFTGGLDLMRALRERLEDDTGVRWYLTHLLHNNASIGGASIRKRYFWVVHRIPFGIEVPEITRIPTVREVLGDLEGLGDTWLPQPYRRAVSWWARSLRHPNGVVDGHWSLKTLGNRRALELIPRAGWAPGEVISDVARRHFTRHGALPELWNPAQTTRLIESDWQMGFHQQLRWRPERISRVVTGAALGSIIHPIEDRFLTHREVARIQGFPDTWRILPLKGRSNLAATWGKGIPVHVGKWVGQWIIKALDGQPGSHSGTPMGERESKIDITNVFRAATHER